MSLNAGASAGTYLFTTSLQLMKKINTITDLSQLLGVSEKHLIYLSLNIADNIRISSKPKPNNPSETRIIAAPSDKLKAVQRNIKDYILNEYSYKSYCYGLGGTTLKQHALVHAGKKTMVQFDLRDFYPSISHESVYKMWVEKFQYTPELARILTKLTTYNGCLQQGYPTSSHIAAIASEEFTSSLNKYCKENSMKFSQYIDDLNISGKHIDQRAIFKLIIPLARKYNFSIKKAKTKVNNKTMAKTITGVSLNGQKTRATRQIRQRAIRALKHLSKNPEDQFSKRRVKGYKGYLKHIHKSDGDRYSKLLDGIE
jgi:RNA-directed DNA polymerase